MKSGHNWSEIEPSLKSITQFESSIASILKSIISLLLHIGIKITYYQAKIGDVLQSRLSCSGIAHMQKSIP